MNLTMCTACGSVEIELDAVTGTKVIDGEQYDIGHGCEVCS